MHWAFFNPLSVLHFINISINHFINPYQPIHEAQIYFVFERWPKLPNRAKSVLALQAFAIFALRFC
jgi:hypothetical protein